MNEPKSQEKPLYHERVVPNFGTFAAVFVLLPSTTIIAEPFDIRIGVAVGVLGVIGIWLLLVFKAPRILVTKSHLRVGRVSIPRALTGTAIVVKKDDIFHERGPGLDPAAFKAFQGTVKTAVRIAIADPDDPTPYWLVSTRRPDKLSEVLNSA